MDFKQNEALEMIEKLLIVLDKHAQEPEDCKHSLKQLLQEAFL
jgi:hypothetical protein